MKLTYIVPTLNQVFDSTLWCLRENTCPPDWQDSIYDAYPSIDRAKSLSLPWVEREKYLQAEFTKIYHSVLPDLKQKTEQLNSLFQSKMPELLIAFNEAFDVDAPGILNDMKGYPNLNTIGPRCLEDCSFYIFYKCSNDCILQTSLHEIIHFFWFYKWQEYFHDDPAEYNAPHLKWVYSEMTVDTFARFSKLSPFFTGRTAYDYFYKMKLGDKEILQILADIYTQKGITGLLTEGFNLIKTNEKQIRANLKKLTGSSCWA